MEPPKDHDHDDTNLYDDLEDTLLATTTTTTTTGISRSAKRPKVMTGRTTDEVVDAVATTFPSDTRTLQPPPPQLQPQQQQQQQQHDDDVQIIQNALQTKIQQLQVENDTLIRNMGTLYRTAQKELERKNQQINDLQQQLQQQQQQQTLLLEKETLPLPQQPQQHQRRPPPNNSHGGSMTHQR